jgi:hypothetical protein
MLIRRMPFGESPPRFSALMPKAHTLCARHRLRLMALRSGTYCNHARAKVASILISTHPRFCLMISRASLQPIHIFGACALTGRRLRRCTPDTFNRIYETLHQSSTCSFRPQAQRMLLFPGRRSFVHGVSSSVAPNQGMNRTSTSGLRSLAPAGYARRSAPSCAPRNRGV